MFLKLKGVEDETELLDIPKSTWHSPKWASKIFHEWQMRRQNRDTKLEECSAFAFDCTKAQNLDTSITQMNGLNFLLVKFMQYLNQMVNSIPCQNLIVCYCLRLKRHLQECEVQVAILDKRQNETR